MQTANLAFRILYQALYYALYLVLLGVLIVSPADLMRQAVQHNNNTNILIIAASYLVTILVLLFVYAVRLYINRSVLASIPKSWIPVDKSDGVPRRVREVIGRDLSRSAAVAWAARPRFEGPTGTGGSRLGTTGGVAGSHGHGYGGGSPGEDGMGVGGVGREKNAKGLAIAVQPPSERRVQSMMSRLKRRSGCTGGGDEEKDIAAAAAAVPTPLGDPESPPVWGEIEHPGWASPTSPDLPNLQYNAVISELPNLIEAKALTLAPRDPESRTEPPTLDPDAVAVLQRPETMGVREYLVHLTEIEVLAPAVVGPFISMYEMARFSTRPMSNQQFRELMHLFAEVLRGMQPLDPAVLLEEYDDDEDGDGENEYGSAIYDTDIDNDAPQGTSSSSGGEGDEEGGSIHGPITTTTTTNNNTTNDEAKSRRSRKSTKLLRDTNPAETYNTTNDNLNTTNNNFNTNLLTRLPSPSSGNSGSISTSSASLSSQRRYSKRQSLAAPGTGTGAGTPGRATTPSMMMRNSSANTWQQNSQQFRTAPTTPKSRRTVLTTRSGGSRRSSSSKSSSRSRSIHSGISGDMDSFAQTRHPFIVGGSSEGEGAGSGSGNGGGSSIHSGDSGQSSGGGSVVIRLSNGDEESVNGLPYILGMGRSPMVGGS